MSVEDQDLHQENKASLEGRSVEQTAEQQKIDEIFNRVREVNEQLGGDLAWELAAYQEDKPVYLFKKPALLGGADGGITVFGVHPREGPIRIVDAHAQMFLQGGRSVVLPEAIREGKALDTTQFRGVDNPVLIEGWQKAFERSRDAVLEDQKRMEDLRAQRLASLDEALKVVSEPIDLNAPSPSATQTPGEGPSTVTPTE